EGHGTGRRDDDGVLDADATDAGEVDAGLHGHDVTFGQRTTGRRGHPRVLVDLEADAVTGAVRERVAPSGVVDDGAARAVDGRALDSRAHGVASRALAREHGVPNAPRLGTGVADA